METRICPACGKPFRPKSVVHRYCSEACRRWGYRHQVLARTEPEGPTRVLRSFHCARCGAPVEVRSVQDHRKRFCSAHCERMYWKHRRKETPPEQQE